jgi:hypothetical protein
VETLALSKARGTFETPLKGTLDGNVKVQFFEVNGREFDHFENVSNALTRLDQGTYGRCENCGTRIQPDVLAEKPWATECPDCCDQESQP